MPVGPFGYYVISKIAEHKKKKQINKSTDKLGDITASYIVFASNNEVDQDPEILNLLEVFANKWYELKL